MPQHPTSEDEGTPEVETGELSFSVDAGLLFQLGEQLVARRSIALSELIKNAYDADATRVDVLLEDVTKEGGTILVQDDGHGMTFERVRDSWMQVATPTKIDEPYSPSGRTRTGAKGVGRFAARRLGDRLTLVTVAQRKGGRREEVTVTFEWSERFKSGQALGSIPVTYTRRRVDDGAQTGTLVSIERVRDAWEEDDVADLRQDLLTLINPFLSDSFDHLRPPEAPDHTASEDGAGPPRRRDAREQFEVVLQSPEFPEQEGDLSDYFLRARWGALAGTVHPDGGATYRLEIRETGEEVTYEAAPGTFHLIPGARFLVFSFVYKGSLFGEFDFGVNDARKIGREVGGVRIYLDDFRVFPYGDQKDDWLRLNEMKASRTPQLLRRGEGMKAAAGLPATERPELLMFGTNQLFGAVEISRFGQNKIEVNVSRERLVENEAFLQLREFVQLGIFWMTVQYSRVTLPEREARRLARQEGAVAKAEDAEALLRRVIELVEARPESVVSQLPEIRDRISDLSSKMGEIRLAAEAEQKDRISERSMLRILASTGTSLSIVSHQLEGLAEGAGGLATDIGDLAASAEPVPPEELVALKTRAEDWRALVEHQMELLGLLLGRQSRLRRRRLVVRNLADRVVGAFDSYRDDHGIKFLNLVPEGLRTPPLYEAELGAVLLNAVTNSLKALRRVEPADRYLAVDGERREGSAIVRVLDTGPGIPAGDRERVFEPYMSTSEPDPILGAGTGLGLMVVRDLLREYGATAKFVDPSTAWTPPAPKSTWRTALEIDIPITS